MTTDLPIFTLSLSIWLRTSTSGRAVVVTGAAGGAGGAAGAVGPLGWPLGGLTASSRFHMVEPPPLPSGAGDNRREDRQCECWKVKRCQYREAPEACLV